MCAANRIEEIELSKSIRKSKECPENAQLQRNKLKCSHPYEKLFLQLYWDGVLKTIIENSYNNFIFFGGGTGNEAAYIRSKLSKKAKLILTDLSYYELAHYGEVFQNYKAAFPDGVLSCSFNQLPFSKSAKEYCAIAFLCLHHSESIERVIMNLLEIFNQAIIFEPITNRVLGFLSRLGIAQRREGVDYRPARLNLSFLEHLKDDFDVKLRTYVQIPRDYLPFISHKQEAVFLEGDMPGERIWSNVFFKIQMFLNYFLSSFKAGNMALLYIRRKNKG